MINIPLDLQHLNTSQRRCLARSWGGAALLEEVCRGGGRQIQRAEDIMVLHALLCLFLMVGIWLLGFHRGLHACRLPSRLPVILDSHSSETGSQHKCPLP